MSKTLFLSLFLLAASFIQAAVSPVRVACVGNSITYGAGIKDRAKDSYPAVLGRLLGDQFQVKNFGFSARTLLNKGDHPYMKEKMFQDALAFQPDIVIIKMGTNDTKPGNWQYQSEFKQDLITMVSSFQALTSHPRVYLCYPATAYTVQWGINDSIIVHGVIPYINEVAREKNLSIIDLHQATAGMPENFPDKIHPNPAGARVMATVVCQAILKDTMLANECKQAKQWLKSRVWANGMKLKVDASVNAVEFQREYRINKVYWDKVFTWLRDNDPQTVAIGKYVLDSGNVTVTVTEGPSVRAFDQTKWEDHQTYVDLQYIAKGKEKMGIAPLSKIKQTVTPYNAKKDVGFYKPEEADCCYVVDRPGTFLLFFPSDAHRPNIQVNGYPSVRKIVFKVRSCWDVLATLRQE